MGRESAEEKQVGSRHLADWVSVGSRNVAKMRAAGNKQGHTVVVAGQFLPALCRGFRLVCWKDLQPGPGMLDTSFTVTVAADASHSGFLGNTAA